MLDISPFHKPNQLALDPSLPHELENESPNRSDAAPFMRRDHGVGVRWGFSFMSRAIDHTGKVYGRLTVIQHEGSSEQRQSLWRCRCECGNETVVLGMNLKRGLTKSCGCFRREHSRLKAFRHGHSAGGKWSPTYHSWAAMVNRCTNQNYHRYKDYGGRGITCCERWVNSFENFLADMGERPPGATIERLVNEFGYFPENCEWRDGIEQANNKRNNRPMTLNGRTQNMTQWAHELGIQVGSLWARLESGWSDEQALTTPVRLHKVYGS